ncbi:MAG: 3-keto-5-aminohexanoate cleavage protein, partial [Paracoccaceae bacterium]|nr:3-keto-5-aminohexanoate cleavage protein [Paracoccaceae bacterium]
LCAFGAAETACLAAAFAQGGKARVGFENSLWHADGSLARDNAERVAAIAALIMP